MFRTEQLNNYKICVSNEFPQLGIDPLVALLELKEAGSDKGLLGGRRSVLHSKLDGVGAVVIKHYARGGLVRHFNRDWFIDFGKSRGQIEFELLQRANNLGIAVPQPVAFAKSGGLVYQAWLVTRELEEESSLAGLALSNEERAVELMPVVSEQIARLVKNRILHIDLHPGNVLVSRSGEIHLLDFDKARDYSGSLNSLRDRYLTRWRRAVIKHSLPEFLSEHICVELRKDFDLQGE